MSDEGAWGSKNDVSGAQSHTCGRAGQHGPRLNSDCLMVAMVQGSGEVCLDKRVQVPKRRQQEAAQDVKADRAQRGADSGTSVS